MGSKTQSFKHVCTTCGYSTNRLSNFKDHLGRKNPCKPKEKESTNNEDNANVNNIRENVNNVNICDMKSLENVNIDVNNVNISESKKKFSCENCGKLFSSRQSKSYHKKSCKAVAPIAISETVEEGDKVDRLEKTIIDLKEELKVMLSTRASNQIFNNTTYNIDNSTTSTTNTTNVINYNNFDSPNFDHITKEMIGEMYLKADRELPRMIGNAVRKIYKGLPENDTIRFKYGNQAGFAEVRQDDETRILPVSDVLETVLSQTTTLCGRELRKCCGPDMIPGPNVVNHAEELSVLHWGFVPETHAKRQGYFKFVKSALL